MRVGLVAAIVAALAIVAGCGGSPPDLGTIELPDPLPDQPGEWRLVTIEGMAPSSEPIEAAEVEIAPDGTTVTAYFLAGDPACYAVTDVDVDRHDPQPPTVTVWHGVRFGVMGCNAALYHLAIVVPLDPPFQDG